MGVNRKKTLGAVGVAISCVLMLAMAAGIVLISMRAMGGGAVPSAASPSASVAESRDVVETVTKKVRFGKKEAVRVDFTAEAGQRLEIELSSPDEAIAGQSGGSDMYAVTWLSNGRPTFVDMFPLPQVTSGEPALIDVPVTNGGDQQVWVTVLDEEFRGQLAVTVTVYEEGQ